MMEEEYKQSRCWFDWCVYVCACVKSFVIVLFQGGQQVIYCFLSFSKFYVGIGREKFSIIFQQQKQTEKEKYRGEKNVLAIKRER